MAYEKSRLYDLDETEAPHDDGGSRSGSRILSRRPAERDPAEERDLVVMKKSIQLHNMPE